MVEREEVGIHVAVLALLGLPLDVQWHRRCCVRGSYSCATVIVMNDHGRWKRLFNTTTKREAHGSLCRSVCY